MLEQGGVRYPDMPGVVEQIVPGMPGVWGGMAFCLFSSFRKEVTEKNYQIIPHQSQRKEGGTI